LCHISAANEGLEERSGSLIRRAPGLFGKILMYNPMFFTRSLPLLQKKFFTNSPSDLQSCNKYA